MKRVALLARAGQAREQLRFALHEAGADIVLEDDPNSIDAGTLAGASPQVVLVALEPAIEDGLSRLEEVLHDPAVAVIFDEADLAARRAGWEAQRWARHLSAKLHGHQDVLPPGREEDSSLTLQPGRPPTPAQVQADVGLDFNPHLEEAIGRAEELPSDDYVFTPQADHVFEPLVDADNWLRQPSQATQPPPLPSASTPPPLPGGPPPLPAAAANKWELSLEPLEAVSLSKVRVRVPGAVMVFAGIGGPDAVRKLLAELSNDFARPLIIHLQLDGGRYDNLVKQMARVTRLPVLLAVAGESTEPGHVYVLPDDVSLSIHDGVVNFAAGGDALKKNLAALPAKDSAILLLSGSDKGLVESAISLARQGGLALGQSQEGCYDPAASLALAAQGATLATPVQLAHLLIQRWTD